VVDFERVFVAGRAEHDGGRLLLLGWHTDAWIEEASGDGFANGVWQAERTGCVHLAAALGATLASRRPRAAA
jgi:hypothetical protein